MSDGFLVGDQLLATKLFVPQVAHALLPRPRLHRLLDQGLRRPLTLVSAPAGFGKTTLVAQWIARMGGRAQPAWLSLDEGDNDPVRFWRYVLTLLERWRPGTGAPLLRDLDAGAKLAAERLTGVVNGLAAAEGQLVLVIDDYHLIGDPEIHAAVGFLLEHLPPQLRLVLLTRAEPPFPLARMRARGQLLELGADQLRCSGEEAAAFFNEVMGLRLDDAGIATVMARAEGWLVGLQLVGLWLREREAPGAVLAELHGSHHYIFDYLIDEVVGRLPPETQAFLLRTSVVDQLSAPLCHALLGADGGEASPGGETDAQAMLEALAKANLFIVPLDAQRRW